jgi:di/tricarboxylate transporter
MVAPGGPAVTTDMLVVFGLVGAVVVLFATERLPLDITALGLLVTLVVLQDYTQVTTTDALAGFSNPATLTILAMYVLSAGVQETGAVQKLGQLVARYTKGSKPRLLAATVGITGPLAGFINNTPVVAMFIPMVTDLADQSHVSPSKLLIPLSYAAMLGGTLTLVGTATNVLVSDLAFQLSQDPRYAGEGLHRISMFEFTLVGVLVLAVGVAYLLTVAQYLLPERIHPVDLTAEFALTDHLHRVYVREASPLVGQTVEEAMADVDLDVDVIQIVRGEAVHLAPATDREIQHQDVLTVRADPGAVGAFVAALELRRLPGAGVTENELDLRNGSGTLVEAVVATDSGLAGHTIADSHLRDRYGATVLGVRRGDTVHTADIAARTLEEGTGLLLHLREADVAPLLGTGDLVLSERASGAAAILTEPEGFDRGRAALAVGIVGAVVGLAAVDALPIVVSALGGVVAMVALGLLRPGDAYDAVSWEVIFLLAGVFPLGVAIQQTGGAAYVAAQVAGGVTGLGVAEGSLALTLALIATFYVLTGLFSNVVTPIASVVLLIPVAVDTAVQLGAPPFPVLVGVMFGASTAFMTPVGYQTNLMVYSPGGYQFLDYVRVGAPLQALLAVVTTVGIWLVFV